MIRLVSVNEVEEISQLALRSKAHWGYSKEFIQACEDELTYTKEMIENEAYVFYLKESNNTIVGFYVLKKLNSDEVELEALFLDPMFIKKGFGKELLNHAKAEAVGFGIKSMHIQSDPYAQDFYEKAGAKLISKKESGSIPGRYLPILTLELNS
ncbi:MAG: GNAT family N-acetyltransferase [Campylobacteraceae bacterium]|nr:GNAT family N-acetyltransferase [Campylobacteraceae bacterium]